jgi:3',5'-cyclic AMP phosphodiesterase CpdA
MSYRANRRDVLRLLGVGGVVFSSALAGAAQKKRRSGVDADFFFLQLSDTHWGYSGPANPEADLTLGTAIQTINGVATRPDFIVFTGDLTHTTDDVGVRHKRMTEFKRIVSGLEVKDLRLMPGEHDASLDRGAAYQQHFGPTHYAFDHKGVHFVALDNVSQGKPVVGSEQIAWLKKDVSRFSKTTPIVVFTHRPLFDLAPEWEWFTGDGDDVMGVLEPFEEVTVLYGHIHRKHDQVIGRARHHAARSLIFAFPDPALGVDKKPVAFDKEKPFANLGVREVRAGSKGSPLDVNEIELSIKEYAGNAGISQLRKGGLFV